MLLPLCFVKIILGAFLLHLPSVTGHRRRGSTLQLAPAWFSPPLLQLVGDEATWSDAARWGRARGGVGKARRSAPQLLALEWRKAVADRAAALRISRRRIKMRSWRRRRRRSQWKGGDDASEAEDWLLLPYEILRLMIESCAIFLWITTSSQ